jgi:hypothetical protein
VQGITGSQLHAPAAGARVSKGTSVQGLPGPHGRSGRARLTRAQRHEPFTPRLPRIMRDRPLVGGGVLAAAGIAGNWLIVHNLQHWPSWTLFPSMLIAALFLATMVIGLGVVTICALEPVLGKMPLEWDAEPVAALGLPYPLQRKLERLGFWTADGLAESVARATFPWTEVDYAERMQIDSAASRWSQARATQRAGRHTARRTSRSADHASEHEATGD